MSTIVVTNEGLFSLKNVRADIWDNGRCVTITYMLRGKFFTDTWTGEHGRYDYEKDFGFQIV